MLKFKGYAIIMNKQDFEENYNPTFERLDNIHLNSRIKIEELQYPLGLKLVEDYCGYADSCEWKVIEIADAKKKMEEKIQEQIKYLQDFQEVLKGV